MEQGKEESTGANPLALAWPIGQFDHEVLMVEREHPDGDFIPCPDLPEVATRICYDVAVGASGWKVKTFAAGLRLRDMS